jgi:hypothetical protein
MITLTDYNQLRDKTIAEGRAGGCYQDSGWIAVLDNGVVGMAAFSHCSCYGTFDALAGGFDWEGTPQEAVAMAHRRADPTMPGREANPKDYDYPQLEEMYRGIIEYFKDKS